MSSDAINEEQLIEQAKEAEDNSMQMMIDEQEREDTEEGQRRKLAENEE